MTNFKFCSCTESWITEEEWVRTHGKLSELEDLIDNEATDD